MKYLFVPFTYDYYSPIRITAAVANLSLILELVFCESNGTSMHTPADLSHTLSLLTVQAQVFLNLLSGLRSETSPPPLYSKFLGLVNSRGGLLGEGGGPWAKWVFSLHRT